MAFIANSNVGSSSIKIKNIIPPLPLSPGQYEIPERYKNSFYLANAAFFDSTNWFLHRAYEVIFPTIEEKMRSIRPKLNKDEIFSKTEGMVNILDQCNSVIDIRFPVKRDNGKYEMIRGFRANHGLASGFRACLGGFRIHENITRDDMKALSVLSTYKNACVGVNMAGAHGGLKIRPQNYSVDELRNIVERYASELVEKGYCSERDVVQPDINTSSREMSWISNTFAKSTGSIYVAAGGKPPDYGGLENYDSMSSQGAYIALQFCLGNEDLMKKCGLAVGLKGKTFIIQGLGKLGKPLARLLIKNGSICVGVKDHDAYIYDARGIDLEKLLEHKNHTGSIKNFGLCKELTDDNIYKEECDILILAARQKSLVCHIARDVKAKLILEASDGPITPSAHKILTSKSKLVVPDIYSCSGSTIASYLEYIWNLQHAGSTNMDVLRFSSDIYGDALKQMADFQQKLALISPSHENHFDTTIVDEKIVSNTIEKILHTAGSEMLEITNSHNLGTDIRTAAYMVAIDTIFKALFHDQKFI
ncbi:unnamed protein product [Phaedon cochleariae]|uniref:Glutamate dehydrogenase n=1 Tax=Phaedon cochleariae TaxID=80249 RepID=A0A9P0DIK0_PHACE|nr:unnamed protein product [Phaedon cochleariae]